METNPGPDSPERAGNETHAYKIPFVLELWGRRRSSRLCVSRSTGSCADELLQVDAELY